MSILDGEKFKFNLGARPLVMPSICHSFVMLPPQGTTQLRAEINKSEVVRGVVLLHYLTGGRIVLRVCPECFAKSGPSRIDIVSFNSMRTKSWSYHGERVYFSKFVPMVDAGGNELSHADKAELISYFFGVANSLRLTSGRDQRDKVSRALSGRRAAPVSNGSYFRKLLSKILF